MNNKSADKIKSEAATKAVTAIEEVFYPVAWMNIHATIEELEELYMEAGRLGDTSAWKYIDKHKNWAHIKQFRDALDNILDLRGQRPE